MADPRLLVVEDNPDIAKLVCHIDARAVEEGSEIPAVYDEFKPEVIVLDILMPDMDGFEILQFLHARESTTQVIILSGDMDFGPMAERIAAGPSVRVAANLVKPFHARELIATLETVKFALPAETAKIPA
jgi:two-component system OmpR family response regulator